MQVIVRFISFAIVRSFDFFVSLFTKNKDCLSETDIPFIQKLHENYQVILEEYTIGQNKRMQSIQDFYKVKTDIKYDDNWKAVPLILFNYRFLENSIRYPKTYELISGLPGCCAAMFSVLGPGKYIPPHKGIYKGIYRCLFVLQTQENAAWILINKKKIYFKNGESVIFDETFEHEVKNESNAPRVALYLDIYRKLPFPLNVLNRLMYFLIRKSPFVKNILKEYKKLEKTTIEDYIPAKAELTI